MRLRRLFGHFGLSAASPDRLSGDFVTGSERVPLLLQMQKPASLNVDLLSEPILRSLRVLCLSIE